MQYGSLTSTQKTTFESKQKDSIRKPTFVLWIEGFGDTTDYVLSIDTEVGLESLRGRGKLNIGRAIIELNNENGSFYSNGLSMVNPCSRIKIWCGFSEFNIPIFSGLVYDLKPVGTRNTVVMNCRDYMGFFFDTLVKNSSNYTPKDILEELCSKIGVLSDITDIEENTAAYNEINIRNQKMISVIESICDSIFCVSFFDEEGIFRLFEREYSNMTDWEFNDDNVSECTLLADTEMINDVIVEYRNGFYSRYFDQTSIDSYKLRTRHINIPSLGHDFVSEKTLGNVEEPINYIFEGFKFTSSENSSMIDTLHIRMKGSDAHGYISIKIYADNDGIPGDLLGISNLKASGNLGKEFVWEVFSFDIPIKISPLTDYWCVIDTSLVTDGVVYTQINNSQITGKHIYYNNSSWHTENNKYILHTIRGNNYAFRLAKDIVHFHKSPHERIQIVAPSVPHLQLMDEVKVDIKKMEIFGRYIIERRRHILTNQTYTTIDTLRKVR
jgi:hypothetical protein